MDQEIGRSGGPQEGRGVMRLGLNVKHTQRRQVTRQISRELGMREVTCVEDGAEGGMADHYQLKLKCCNGPL